MKNNIKVFFIVLLTLSLLTSCHKLAEVAIIKNNLKSEIIVGIQPDDVMTDSTLYNEYFRKNLIKAGAIETIDIPNRVPGNSDDSEKVYLYVFNKDSLYKYQNLKIANGIIKKAFLRKISIQLNKITSPMDTIYITESNFENR